uniref:Immunoglobulin domain-containing protein n=1 Tax=Leptobrachium leishanense TaxID=445787 RepID=A0A8C5R4T6_9ANUR
MVIFFLLAAQILVSGHELLVPLDSISATVGQNVLLPASYVLSRSLRNCPSVHWSAGEEDIVHFSIVRCSFDSLGFPTSITGETRISYDFRGRVEFYQLNGSLLLKNIQLNDSGTYYVKLLSPDIMLKKGMYLSVQENTQRFGHKLFVHLDSINATVGQNIVLPVSYVLSRSFRNWPSVHWSAGKEDIVRFTLVNRSLDAQSIPTLLDGATTISPGFQGRVEFYPGNGSLLLKNIQLNDSGTYYIKLLSPNNMVKKKIYVYVQRNAPEIGHELLVHLDSINATVGQNVLLPASYILSRSFHDWPSVHWSAGKEDIVHFSLVNVSTDAQGFPTWTDGETRIFTGFEGRVEFYPGNGSLLMKNIQLNDSGTYYIKLLSPDTIKKKGVHVYVQRNTRALGHKLVVHQDSIDAVVGKTVLLPTSYSISRPFRRWPSIEWTDSKHTIVYYTFTNGTLDPQGFPTHIVGQTKISTSLRERVEFYHMNGSLLLKNICLNDSGTYHVNLHSFESTLKKEIRVVVKRDVQSTGHELLVHLDSINATVGQNVLLPASYILSHSLSNWPSIHWSAGAEDIVHFSLVNVSIDAQGFPTWTDGDTRISSGFQGRVKFYPRNGSLLLKNIQLNDSGTYYIKLLSPDTIKIKGIYLSVRQNTLIFENDAAERKGFIRFITRTVFCFPPLVTLVFLIHRWRCQ